MKLSILKKGITAVVMGCGVMALAACHSSHKNEQMASAVDDANAAYSSHGVRSSGLGDQSGFGDRANGSKMYSERTYYFDYDRSEVKDEYKPAILANADYLLAHPHKRIILEGHTDPRGSREYNIGLGERRSRAVAAILTAKGVNPSQIRIVSYGAEKLAAQGRDEAAYTRDRRAVIAFIQT